MGVGAGGDGVSVLVAAWERRMAAARAGDILRGLRAKRARAMRLAHHAAQTHDATWRDQGVYIRNLIFEPTVFNAETEHQKKINTRMSE